MICLLPHLCELRLSLPPGRHTTCSVVLCPFDPPQGKDLEKGHCHLPRTSLHPTTTLPLPSSAAPSTILSLIRSPIPFPVPSSAAAVQSAFQLLPVPFQSPGSASLRLSPAPPAQHSGIVSAPRFHITLGEDGARSSWHSFFRHWGSQD